MNKAEWKMNGIFKADAQKVADEIGDNRITPQQILEKARDEKSELHKCFEWDDSIAAEKYRLQQAGTILRMLVFKSKNEDEQPVRVFQITTERNTYQPVKMFLKQEDEYQSLLKRALGELESFKKRYSTLSELESVFDAISEL